MGRGTENEEYYSNIRLSFHNLPNLDDVQLSYKKILSVFKLRKNKPKSYWKGLGDSSWYDHISLMLEFALFIIESLE